MSRGENKGKRVKENQAFSKKLWERDGVSIWWSGGWVVRGGKMPAHYFGDASIGHAMEDAALRLGLRKAKDLREFIRDYREALTDFRLTLNDAMVEQSKGYAGKS